jgi:chromosome segregation ATPase
MIRRLILAGGLATVGSAVLFGSDAVSYLRTSTGYFKQSVYNAVPVEFQIQRARQMLRDLVPEVQKNMHLIAREEVEVDRMANQIAELETRLAKEKDQISRLKQDLTSGKTEFRYGGRQFDIEQVRLDLGHRFERYRTGDATLSSLHQMHLARQKGLDAARQKLDGMLASRRQLQVEVENLEARNQMVAAARTTSNYQFDDSHLGRVKALVDDLKARLEVDERLVHAEGQFQGEIPVDKPDGKDVIEQVTKYFAMQEKKK